MFLANIVFRIARKFSFETCTYSLFVFVSSLVLFACGFVWLELRLTDLQSLLGGERALKGIFQ